MTFRIRIERSAESDYGYMVTDLADLRTGKARDFPSYADAEKYLRGVCSVPAPATITYKIVDVTPYAFCIHCGHYLDDCECD